MRKKSLVHVVAYAGIVVEESIRPDVQLLPLPVVEDQLLCLRTQAKVERACKARVSCSNSSSSLRGASEMIAYQVS